MMIRLNTGNANARRIIEKVGETHASHALDIRPELYELWLNSLCEAVQRHDPAYHADLEAAWRESMQEGIQLVTTHY